MTALQTLLDNPDRTLVSLGLDYGGYLTTASTAAGWDNFDKHNNWDNWRNR